MSNMWEALASVQESTLRKPAIRGGFSVIEIASVELKATRQCGDAFIVEGTILATTGRNRVGEEISWYQGSQHRDVFMSSMKGFVLALLRSDPALMAWAEGFGSLDTGPVWGQIMEYIAPKPPAQSCFTGRKIGVVAIPKVTKVNKKLILDYRWETAPESLAGVVFDPANPPADVPVHAPQAPAAPAPYGAPPATAPAPWGAPAAAAPAPWGAPVAPPAPVPPPSWGAAPPAAAAPAAAAPLPPPPMVRR